VEQSVAIHKTQQVKVLFWCFIVPGIAGRKTILHLPRRIVKMRTDDLYGCKNANDFRLSMTRNDCVFGLHQAMEYK
jgi:hypothetical protein